jgi:predicted acylesterase/phospholipase RssA
VSFNEHTQHDDLLKVLQASVSFPGVFKPIEAFDSMWFSNNYLVKYIYSWIINI